MVDMLICGITEYLYERFNDMAVKHQRSLSAEMIYLMEQAIEKDEQLEQRRAAVARIAARRCQLPVTPADVPDSLTMLREDRERNTD